MEGFFNGVRPKFFRFDVRFEIFRKSPRTARWHYPKAPIYRYEEFPFFHFFQFLQHHIGREETDGVLKIVVR